MALVSYQFGGGLLWLVFLFVCLFFIFLFIETRSQVAGVGLHVAETDLELLIPCLYLPSTRIYRYMPQNLIFMWWL